MSEMGKIVHLKEDLKPEPLKNKNVVSLKSVIRDFIKVSEKTFPEDRQLVNEMTPTAGTDEQVYKGQNGQGRDMGLFMPSWNVTIITGH